MLFAVTTFFSLCGSCLLLCARVDRSSSPRSSTLAAAAGEVGRQPHTMAKARSDEDLRYQHHHGADDKAHNNRRGNPFQPQSGTNPAAASRYNADDQHDSKPPPPPPVKPAGKPPFFHELGKPVKDFFTKGFTPGHTLTVSCLAPGGTVLSTTATMTEGVVVGLVNTSFKRAGVVTELSAGTTNQISVGTTYEDLVPGLKLNITTTVPDSVNFGKTQIQYQHDFAAVSTTLLGFKSKPAVEFSTNVGNDKVSLGSSFVYNTETKALTGLTAGLGYAASDRTALLLFDPQSQKSVDAYGMQSLSPTTSVGVHLNHKLEKNLTTATLAGSYKLDPQSTVKGRINNYGIVGALLQYEPNPLASFGMYAEVDTKCLTTAKPKIGLSLSLLGAV